MKPTAKTMLRMLVSGVLAPYVCGARLLFELAIRDILRSDVRAVGYEGVKLIGDDDSLLHLKEALDVLSCCDPSGLSLVRRYLRKIVCSHFALKRGFIVGSFFFTPEMLHDLDLRRFASLLVRHAVLSRLFTGYRMAAVVFYHRGCMKAALSREYRSIERLKCGDEDLREQLTFLRSVS